MVDRRTNADRMELQTAEFDALNELIKKYNSLPAVVDADYPRCRNYYEIALYEFIAALRNNDRM